MKQIVKMLPFGQTFWAILFLLVQTGCALCLPYITAGIVNRGVLTGDTAFIWRQGGLMIALSAASVAGALLNVYFSARVSYRLGAELRGLIYKKVLEFTKNEFDTFGASSLITRGTQDVTQVQNLIEMGLKFMILAPLYLTGGIILTYLLSPKISLIFIGAIPFLALAGFFVYRFSSPLYAKMQALQDQLNLVFREGLTGARVIRAFNKEDREYEKYQKTNTDYTKTAITAGTIMSVFGPLVAMLMGGATILIMWIGAGSAAAGAIEIGAIMGAVNYALQILIGFSLMMMVILSIPRGQISARRVNEVLNIEVSVENVPLLIDGERLAVNHLTFSYPHSDKKALEDICFEVKNGQTLAIIGSTGSGKSTLVNRIARRTGCVSFAPQKSILFFGTIRSNMHIAKPEASDEEIWRVLKIAQAAEFVQSLDDCVEKGGGNFSGGQKQRLCIARTLLKEAKAYVFDDSFSALDFKTDSEVRAAMKAQTANAVTIIVAQRAATVANADFIAVLDNGRLAGFGTHAELRARCAVYNEIIESQAYTEVAS
ncbi:MAG: ABC transporter ATP-binding protein/permease [Peptococcaceae bacterium]|jgi:ATP-binding cassette subfamily B protein|nr:ABC transporter ATP-binding protein/permease [Peptococcaceae bacterium]